MPIGQNLRYYRKMMGFTQEQLAESICHTTYISKIENSNILPPKETLSDLCMKLGITLEQLTQNVDEEKWLLLDDWLERIIERKDANKQYNHLASVFQDVENPFLMSRYFIILLRYFILIKDRQKAKSVLHNVNSYENYVTSETEYDLYFSLGLYEYHYGSLKTSYTYYVQAERIMEEQGVKNPELFYYMALTLSRLNKVFLSTIYVKNALEIYNEKMNFSRSTDCNLILGINFNLMEEYDKAEEFFQKIINGSGFHDQADLLKGRAYHNLGNIYSKQGQSGMAIDMLHKSLEFKQLNAKSNTKYLLAREYFLTGEVEKGKEWLSKGMKLVNETGDSDYELKLSILSFRINEIFTPQYHDLLKKAISYFKNTDLNFSCECAELLAKLQAEKFYYKEAYEYLQLASDLRKHN